MIIDPRIIIKPGVVLEGVDPCMIACASDVADLYDEYGADCWITSGREAKHSGVKSKHRHGKALDFRKWTIPTAKRNKFTQELRKRLGDKYKVIHEKTHFHVQKQ